MFSPHSNVAPLGDSLPLPLPLSLPLPLEPTNGRLQWPAAVLVMAVLCAGLWGVVWLATQAFIG